MGSDCCNLDQGKPGHYLIQVTSKNVQCVIATLVLCAFLVGKIAHKNQTFFVKESEKYLMYQIEQNKGEKTLWVFTIILILYVRVFSSASIFWTVLLKLQQTVAYFSRDISTWDSWQINLRAVKCPIKCNFSLERTDCLENIVQHLLFQEHILFTG